MSKITVSTYIPPIVYLYDNEDNCIHKIINEYQLNEVRIQIIEQNLIGYYIMYGSEKITINEYGVLSSWPKGLYDLQEKQLAKILRLAMEKRKRL